MHVAKGDTGGEALQRREEVKLVALGRHRSVYFPLISI